MKKAVWIPICFLFLVGCGTGDNSPGQTTISFSLPHSMQSSELRSAVTGSQLAFYAVQTSGSADRKIIWHKCETHCESAPPTISLDQVPLGQGITIQVLAAYHDDTAKQSTVYYGDTPSPFVPTDGARTVQIQFQSSINSADQGLAEIAGRFASGSTGNVEILFHPENKPVMSLDVTSVVAGWFQFFMVPGAKLTYRLDDGTELFSQISITDLESLVGNSVIRAHRPPTHIVSKDTSGNVTSSEAFTNQYKTTYYGLYGGSSPACFDSSIDGKPVFDATTGSGSIGLYTDSAGAQKLNFALSGGAQTLAITGGKAITDPLCSAADAVRFKPEALTANAASKSSSGFSQLFDVHPGSQDGKGRIQFSYSTNTQQLTMDWQALSGVSTAIDSFVVYRISAAQGQLGSLGDVKCHWLAQHGFEVVAEVGATQTQATVSNLPLSTFQSSDFVICAKSNGVLLAEGYDLNVRSGSLAGCTGDCSGFLDGDGPRIGPTSVGQIGLVYTAGIVVNVSGAQVQFRPQINSPVVTSSNLSQMAFYDASGTGNGDLSGIPPYAVSAAFAPALSKPYVLLGNGQLQEYNSSTGQLDACQLEVCQIPVWMQSFSVDATGKVYGLDHGGNFYHIDTSGGLTLVTTVSPHVTHVLYF